MFKLIKKFDKWYWHLISIYTWGAFIGPLFAVSKNLFLIVIDIILFLLLSWWTVKIMMAKD